MWQLIDTSANSAEFNMQFDAELLEKMRPDDAPILHLYDWKYSSATYGYFIPIKQYLNLDYVQKVGFDLARRPTGGGIVFHVSDLAFSALVPANHPGYSNNTLANYKFINDAVLIAIEAYLKEIGKLSLLPQDPVPLDSSAQYFCMAKPTIYDVMLGHQKVAGAAQRKRKQGFLHQGTISIALPKQSFLEEILLPGTSVFHAMQQYTFSLLSDSWTDQDLQDVRESLKKHLKQSLVIQEEKQYNQTL